MQRSRPASCRLCAAFSTATRCSPQLIEPALSASLVWCQVYKLFIVVELLMGDIPERSVFRQPVLKRALVPYLHIVQGGSDVAPL